MITAERKRLGELIPTAYTGAGLFSAIVNPVWAYDFEPMQLDIYFISNYGEKWAAPYLMHISGGNILSSDKINQIANTIYRMYKSQWEHLYKSYSAEYNPLHNTDATEVETINKVGNENTQTANSSEGTSSGTTSNDTTGSGSVTNKRSGFNSSSDVRDTSGDNSSTANSDGSNTQTDEASSEGSETVNNTETVEREHRKFGNIGTVTTAQLIGGEIDLWKWNFIKQVMQDISDTIALSIY